MKKLLIATLNQGKLGDYKNFLSDLPLELVTLFDTGVVEEFEEIHTTFEENARGKAEFYVKLSGLPTLADDSGIEIPFYNMEPGVNTKMWDGTGKNDEAYQNFILEKIEKIPEDQRQAQLRAVLALNINGETYLAEGKIEGILTDKVYSGTDTHGYPWDRVFIIPEVNKYYEELTPAENFRYNHRRIAIDKLKPFLKSLV